MHVLCDIPCPSFSNIDLKLSLTGLSRLIGRPPRQALPITLNLLCRIYHILDKSNAVHIVMWSLCTMAFFTLSLKSNLVAKSHKKQHLQQLRRHDVTSCKFGLIVTFRWSKTNQFGDRLLRIPVLAIPNSILCPVSAYQAMLKLVPVPLGYPAYIWPSATGDYSPVTYYQLHSFLRTQLDHLGVDSSKYSSHSFRRGGASWTFNAGVSPELIQTQGDWKSDAYL